MAANATPIANPNANNATAANTQYGLMVPLLKVEPPSAARSPI
jgi:hypothetical protein